ncbi:MAG TPA: ABC transporter permease [Phycisphaerae bacterium]|nr:ABC transporter permease [Phycisphaerae bacterium]
MIYVAIKMLTGDRVKYLGIIAGLALSSFLVTQQLSIFVGLMSRTFSVITDITQPDIWVMDPQVKNIDDSRPMPSPCLYRVKAVKGVAWAVPLFKGQIKARLPSGSGYTCTILGLDNETLVGGPPEILPVDGHPVRMDALRQPDAIFVDGPNAKEKLGGLKPGDVLELNDNRAKVVALTEITQGFQALPVIHTTYSRATEWVPGERNQLSFVLVKAQPGENIQALCNRITADTGLNALTQWQFKSRTLWYYIRNTGIPINFGATVTLGFVIGIAISGLLFYQFTMDNIRHFGMLKAMGAGTMQLIRMILVQTGISGAIGFGLGMGMTTLFKEGLGAITPRSQQVMLIMWQTIAITGTGICVIVVLASLFAMIKVIRLEPAIVFK